MYLNTVHAPLNVFWPTPAIASPPPPQSTTTDPPSFSFGISPGAKGSEDPLFFNKFFLVDRVIRVNVSLCQISWYWGFISSSSSPATMKGKGEIVFSMVAPLKMRAITSALASPSI
jgi:hypothetical protein